MLISHPTQRRNQAPSAKTRVTWHLQHGPQLSSDDAVLRGESRLLGQDSKTKLRRQATSVISEQIPTTQKTTMETKEQIPVDETESSFYESSDSSYTEDEDILTTGRYQIEETLFR